MVNFYLLTFYNLKNIKKEHLCSFWNNQFITFFVLYHDFFMMYLAFDCLYFNFIWLITNLWYWVVLSLLDCNAHCPWLVKFFGSYLEYFEMGELLFDKSCHLQQWVTLDNIRWPHFFVLKINLKFSYIANKDLILFATTPDKQHLLSDVQNSGVYCPKELS